MDAYILRATVRLHPEKSLMDELDLKHKFDLGNLSIVRFNASEKHCCLTCDISYVHIHRSKQQKLTCHVTL